MSKVGIGLKIDVTKIDKNRLFKGNKGVFLDVTTFVDLDEFDQYGNSGMITQDVYKEEREAGIKGPILGNCKVFWPKKESSPVHPSAPAADTGESFDDDIPF